MALSLALMVVLVFTNVVMRYAFSYTPVWSEESFRILLVWCVMAGAAVSVRDKSNKIESWLVRDQRKINLC